MERKEVNSEKQTLVQELSKKKRDELITKQELSQAKLDRSAQLDELLERERGGLLRKLGQGGGEIRGKVDMRSRFMDFKKLKSKYSERTDSLKKDRNIER